MSGSSMSPPTPYFKAQVKCYSLRDIFYDSSNLNQILPFLNFQTLAASPQNISLSCIVVMGAHLLSLGGHGGRHFISGFQDSAYSLACHRRKKWPESCGQVLVCGGGIKMAGDSGRGEGHRAQTKRGNGFMRRNGDWVWLDSQMA